MFPSITHDDVYRIETPRLWLRWPQSADASAIADFARHKQVAEMTASI
ncbi:MAG: N-acetyltransferase, partial [Hyphomicrobiales bacterium]|nr:N-acetyltransferase [Hyphomicrobiales bacterium]